MTLEVRPMQARDIERVVEIHMAAFPGFFLTQLGRTFLATYYGSAADSDLSISLVADADDTIAGFVVGSSMPEGFYRKLLRERWPSFARAALPTVVRHPRSVLRVIRALRHPCAQAVIPGTGGVFSIASDPAAQRGGIGGTLMNALVQRLRDDGCAIVRLETDRDGNEGVRRFYEGLGFVPGRTWDTPEGRGMVEYTRVIDEGRDSVE